MNELPNFFDIEAPETIAQRRYKIYMPTGAEDVYIVAANSPQDAHEQILEGNHNPVQRLAGENFAELETCYVLHNDDGTDEWEEINIWAIDA